MRSPDRRSLLELAAGAAGGLLAGCLSDATGTGTTTTDGVTTSETEATTSSGLAAIDAFDWREWPPADDDAAPPDYWTFYADTDAVTGAGLTDTAIERVRRLFVALPADVLALEETSAYLSLGRASTVCTYDVETAALRERLEAAAAEGDPTTATASAGTEAGSAGGGTDTGTPPTEDGTTQVAEDTTAAAASAARAAVDAPDGYEGYATPDGYAWLASDHLLFAERPATLEALHATGTGDGETLLDSSALGPAVDAVGDVDLFVGRPTTQQFVADATAFGYAWTFDDRAALTAAFAFPEATAVDREGVAALAEEPGFAEYGDAEVAVDGRVATLEASIATGEFDFLKRPDDADDGGSSGPPQVAFGFDFDRGGDGEWDGADDERIRITHEGGDSVPLEQVTVTYEGVDVAESANVASTPPDREDWAAGGVWELAVDTTDFAFESGATVRVVWTSAGGDRAAVLAEATLP